MTLEDHFNRSGAWLFRYRSVLPIPALALLLLAVHSLPRPFTPLRQDGYWELLCLTVSLLGLLIRCVTIGRTPRRTSGRNTHSQIADTLNTTAMYSLVRHPLYLGNAIILLGICSFPQQWWIDALAIALFALYYERIMFAEESFLRARFGEAFEQWAARTPAILPHPLKVWRSWRPSTLPFSLRNVLRREYNGLFAIVLITFLLDVDENQAFEQPLVNPAWLALLSTTALLWLVLRLLKRRTTWLRVEGR